MPDDDSSSAFLGRLPRAPWGTIVSLGFLLLAATILYLVSRSSAIKLSSAAHILASSARRVAVDKGDEGAIERELMLKLSDIERRDDLSEGLLHLAIACFVAIIIILTVELYSSSRTRREIMHYRDSIASEVWSALAGRLVPPRIVDEIRGILKSDAVKEDVRYTLTLLRYDGLPDGVIVLQRKVTYTIRNITGKHLIHPVRSLIHNTYPDLRVQDKSGETITLPRHVELRVRDQAVTISEEAGTLQRNKHGQLRDLQHDIELTRQADHAEVFISTEEPVPMSGSNPYVQAVPVIGLTVFIDNRIEDIVRVHDVKLAHPNWQEFAPDGAGIYHYVGALLPGQAFTILWEPTHASGTGTGPEGITKV